MNHNIQTNVSRKKIVSSQEKTSSRRDVNKKNNLHVSNELSNSKVPANSLKDNEKSSMAINKNSRRGTNKNLLQKDSLETSSVSRSKFPADRPIIDQSINLSVNTKLKNKISSKTISVTQKSNINTVKNKLRTQVSDDNEKRGVSTIYIPKKNSHTAKEISELNKKDRSKSVVKNKDSSSNSHSTNTNRKNVPSRERKKSRTLSPSEVKVLKTNIKTPGVSSDTSLNKQSSQPASSSSDCDYEDDFEDYESDFQECTDSDENETSEVSDESVTVANESEPEPIELQMQKIEKKIVTSVPTKKYFEEEHMLDSGHYELQEARRRAARYNLITTNQNVKASTSTTEHSMLYSDEKPSETKSLPSSADEGFEDGRSGDFAKSPPIFGISNPLNSVHRDKTLNDNLIKSKRRHLTRGKQLLQMIKLDIVEWSLYESTPIAYEEFIRIHGKINTRQISTQTNEDNLSVEVQTDEIKYKNMWTQFPITCRNVLKNTDDIDLFMAELAGVGSDEINIKPYPQYDILELNEFIGLAGNAILALLESKQSRTKNFITDAIDTHQLPFGQAIIKLSISNVTFLSGRPVTMIRYSDISSTILLTIHDRVDDEVETLANEDFYITDCCIGCQWNIFEPSRPIKLFYSTNNITACRFHPTNYNIVFGGLEDGSMSLWDLGENESYHRRIIDKENKLEWILRCVTFNSAGAFEDQTQSKIIALTVLSKTEINGIDDIGKFMPLQICSLNEEGGCIVWSVLRNFDGISTNNQDFGQSWWGKFRLIKSHDIPININKEIDMENFIRDFRDISVDSIDTNNLYITSNICQVFHVTRFGTKPKPAMFNGIDFIGGTTCIEICPFGQPFFLVGCEDGTVQLYSSTIKKPLLQLKNLDSCASIKTIQWSKSKPLTIYVLDNNAKIHVWDLNQSHNSPVCNITPDKYAHVVSMQLSPWRTDHDMMNQYMAIGLDNGTIEIHKFNQNFHYSKKDDLLSELKLFLDYLEIY